MVLSRALTRGVGKKLAVMGFLVALAGSVRPVYVIGVMLGFWQPLTRPRLVSPAAHYVSWVEDGTWFDCAFDSKRDVDVCKAWDSNGRPLANGDFRLECLGRAATSAELRPSFVSSSGGIGHEIYLFGDKGARSWTLVPAALADEAHCPTVTITYPPSSKDGRPND